MVSDPSGSTELRMISLASATVTETRRGLTSGSRIGTPLVRIA